MLSAKRSSRSFSKLLVVVLASAVALGSGLAGVAEAKYEVVTDPVKRDDGTWRVTIMNEDGFGDYVYGKTKRKAKKAAQQRVDELNEAENEGGVVDDCFNDPEGCFN